MIKRNGVEVMNARTKNVSIAKETIQVSKVKSYKSLNGNTIDISKLMDDAIAGTIYYPEGTDLNLDVEFPIKPTIEVTNETTTQAALRLGALGKEKIVALNFASARNQGGGFLAGAMAQEEDLCRKSGLYTCLKTKPLFYNANILCDSIYYTDGIIYSPNVPFFRDENNLFIEQPWDLSVITSPAPNLSGTRPEGLQFKLKGLIRERAIKIVQVAHNNAHKTIILGAWGCGAFGNDPVMVAEAFKLALTKVPAFEYVCFAVYDTREPPIVYESFAGVFK